MYIKIGNYPTRGNSDRKINVRIDDHDVWNADKTLAYIIHPVLLKIKEKKQGSPYVNNEDVPVVLRNTNPLEWEDDTVHERWSYVLDEMIWAFNALIHDNEEPSWLDDKDAAIAYSVRLENGLKFFGKYYCGLWT